jgi:hypothetical protein
MVVVSVCLLLFVELDHILKARPFTPPDRFVYDLLFLPLEGL